MQKRVVESQADETRTETDKVAVETRLTAEQFHRNTDLQINLSRNIVGVETTLREIYQLMEAFRDKSEAGLREEIERLPAK